jgi:hypothetical protein
LISANKKYGNDLFPLNIIEGPGEKEDGLVLVHSKVWHALDELKRQYKKNAPSRSKTRSDSAKASMAPGGANRALLILRSTEQTTRTYLSKLSSENLDKTKKSIEKVFLPENRVKLNPKYTEERFLAVLQWIEEYKALIGKSTISPTNTLSEDQRKSAGGRVLPRGIKGSPPQQGEPAV